MTNLDFIRNLPAEKLAELLVYFDVDEYGWISHAGWSFGPTKGGKQDAIKHELEWLLQERDNDERQGEDFTLNRPSGWF